MGISYEIYAELRNDMGKGASRRLRRAGRVPAIIYGTDKDPVMISVDHNVLTQKLEYEAFYSHILSVDIGGSKERVVLKDLQRHPSKPFITHLDLQRISDETKIRVRVPLHFIGEDLSPGLQQGGAVAHNLIDVEISCLPKDLPEFLEADLGALDIGDSVHLSELKLPEGVEIPALLQGPEQDLAVAMVHSGRGGSDEEYGEGPEGPEEPEEPAAEPE